MCSGSTRGSTRRKDGGLPESGLEPHQGEGRPRAREVLHVDDLAVPQSKGLRPVVALTVLVGPGERDNDMVTVRPDRIEAVVPIPELPSRRYPFLENPTGLIGAVSGRRLPEPRQPAASAPLHVGVDQRGERLDVAVTERLKGGANRVNSHASKIPPSRINSRRAG